MQVTNRHIKKWTFFCAFGELSGIAIAGTIAFFVNTAVGEPQTLVQKLAVLISMLVAGAIEGSLLGWFQWKILKEITKIRKAEWMRATILVAVLGWFRGMLPSLFFVPPAGPEGSVGSGLFDDPLVFAAMCIGSGLVLGAIFGTFQYFVLRKYMSNAAWWILANALGWGVGLGWIYAGASLPDEQSGLVLNIVAGASGGILAGLSVGVITGLFLRKLKER
jgi:hypothetical protein